MPSGAPAEASLELYNRLIHLPFSNITEIGQIEFRLRALHRKSPSDFRARVAFLQALMMSGKAKEAIEVADSIWGARSWLESDTKETFIGQIVELGMYDRANELISALLVRDRETLSPILTGIIVQLVIGRGDIQLLKKIAQWEFSRDFRSRVGGFLIELERAGLEKHFAEHQRLVHNVVFGHQCTYVGSFQKNEGHFELSVYIYVNEEPSARRRLEEQIDAALFNYYEKQGIDPTAYVPLITTNVFNLIARHPPSEY